jgi:hypothetical protein
LLILAFATVLAASHFLTFAFALTFAFTGLRGAELALHALRHLPPAFGQGADRLLLCGARVSAFGERFRSVTHGAIGLSQGGGYITGQFTILLHQCAQRTAERTLRARILRRFFAGFWRLRARRRWPAHIRAGIFLLSAAAMRAVKHFRFPPHHILKRTHLLLAALALLALAILGPARAAFFKGLQHFLKLGHFPVSVFLAAITRGVFQPAGAAFQFAAIKDALLRVVG